MENNINIGDRIRFVFTYIDENERDRIEKANLTTDEIYTVERLSKNFNGEQILFLEDKLDWFRTRHFIFIDNSIEQKRLRHHRACSALTAFETSLNADIETEAKRITQRQVKPLLIGVDRRAANILTDVEFRVADHKNYNLNGKGNMVQYIRLSEPHPIKITVPFIVCDTSLELIYPDELSLQDRLMVYRELIEHPVYD